MTSQHQFIRALTDPAQPVPVGLVSPRGTADTKRFAVYRNNVHVSLVGAIAARFPVTRQLVGEEFFTGMARLYVGQNKPRGPVLLHYGDSFPDFIGQFPPAAGLPYLPDLARLEAAWTETYNAADAAVLMAADLNTIAGDALAKLDLALAPSTRLVRSSFPVGSLWSAHQTTPVTIPALSGSECVLLTRPQAEVRLTIIPPAAFTFLKAIEQGRNLGRAAEAVLADFPDFDPGAALVGLAGLGVFAALDKEHVDV
ncbi:hypothetical protein GGR20_003583 [Devosia subaequoris]|uniref:Putative DNA-binding domain-containing protein n=1 Tax=Devosia subaequoris TaxID=395930 RepID=A0A7W6IQC9_9HYPH|nr:hypothetical protein [Devosia subaequoris]MCP1211339.1 DNA-binding domain-containing protein [Devosia subaequoris]